MINDPSQATKEPYIMLFQLWSGYPDDVIFRDELIILIKDYPIIVRIFKNCIHKLESFDNKKAIALKERLNQIIMENNLMDLSTPTIFISYSHKDEEFKDELITMLAGLQRQGILNTWQDRQIHPGVEWFNAIKKAMDECDMAILLVSPDFIASRFIQEQELFLLFQRRIEEGLRVVPIIVRPCLWQSEPTIKEIQVLPKDAKPIISFSKNTGERDHVWAEIGKVIENIAKGG